VPSFPPLVAVASDVFPAATPSKGASTAFVVLPYRWCPFDLFPLHPRLRLMTRDPPPSLSVTVLLAVVEGRTRVVDANVFFFSPSRHHF